MKKISKKALAKMDADLLKAEAETARSIAYIQSLGVELPDRVINVGEWLTIKRYAREYNLSVDAIMEWIDQGIIPADCIHVEPELDNLILIKSQLYRQS